MIFKYSKPANPNVPEELREAARTEYKRACKHKRAMMDIFGGTSELYFRAHETAATIRHLLEDLGILSSEELDAIGEGAMA